MKNKLIIGIFSLSLLLSFVAGAVTLNGYVYYDRENSKTVLFGYADKPYSQSGILVSDDSEDMTVDKQGIRVFPAKYDINGRFGILLEDPDKILGKYYYVRSYAKYGEKNEYSENIIKVKTSVIKADRDNIENVVENAEPGDEIVLAPGVYNNLTLNVKRSGNFGNPIVIRSEEDGKVTVTGDSHINISGSNVTVKGIFFKECLSEKGKTVYFSDCNNSRITECAFISCGGSAIPTVRIVDFGRNAKKCRIDNCVFKDSRGLSVGITANKALNYSQSATECRIDHNYFLDIKNVSEVFPGEYNGLECVQTGTEYRDDVSVSTVVEYNRFENVTGDCGEIFSNKSNGNIFRYNTFLNCRSGLSLRTGNGCSVIGNILINVDAGLSVYGRNHIVKDNYFYQSRGIDLGAANGDGLSNLGDYKVIADLEITNNIFVYPTSHVLRFGRYFDTTTYRTLLPENVSFANNNIITDNEDAVVNFSGYGSITFDNNCFTTEGAGLLKDAKSGFNIVERSVYFDGELMAIEGVETCKEGYITIDTGKWWFNETEVYEDVISDFETGKNPVAYKPPADHYYVCSGEKVNVCGLSGTAIYNDSSKKRVLSKDVIFTRTGGNFGVLEGKELTFNNTGDATYSTTINSNYKGLSVDTKFYVANKASAIGDNLFGNTLPAIFSYGGSTSYWNTDKNALSLIKPQNTQTSAIIYNYFHSGDFKLAFDYNCKKTADDNDFIIHFGFKNFPKTEDNKIVFGKNSGIYNSDIRIGEIKKDLEENRNYRIEVSKKVNYLVVSVDDEIYGLAYIGDELFGKIGFGGRNNNINITNIAVNKNEEPAPVVKRMRLTAARADYKVLKISVFGIPEGCVARLFKDGNYVADIYNTEYFIDPNINISQTYKYTALIFDKNGNITGIGEASKFVNEPGSNDFFMVTDVKVKAGENGSYISNYYCASNRFLREGSYPHWDRVYKYNSLPEKFVDCAYIKTANSDRSLDEFKKERDDWLSFYVNRSATVYVAVMDKVPTPAWLSDWTKEEGDGGISVTGLPNPKCIYSKHILCVSGLKKEVKLGGFSYLGTVYYVIIKPDIMPDPIEIKRYDPTLF